MKKTLKHIIAAMLAMAIALTGISFDNAITANAAAIDGRFTPNGSITMNSIDEMKNLEMIVTDDFGIETNLTNQYKWTSSDESVVSVKVVQENRIMREYDYILLTAHKNGTATITGTFTPDALTKMDSAPKTATMTVTVNAPTASTTAKAKKMTAKQRKCKHNYKISKKATCTRTGLKICKKCKWQVSIKKSAHLWSVETWYDMENTKEYYVVYCSGRDCELYGSTKDECYQKYGTNVACPHACTWESGPCETYEEAFNKWMYGHGSEIRKWYEEHEDAEPGVRSHASCGDRWEYGDPQKVKVTVKTCTKCGEEKVSKKPVQ